MITAVDTNVLLDIFADQEPFTGASRSALGVCAGDGPVIACDVVWAETVAWFRSPDDMRAAMERMEVQFVSSSMAAAQTAGAAWRAYRSAGGPRERVLPDFLIAAHALTLADRLLTRDFGFYRRYFRELVIVDPMAP